MPRSNGERSAESGGRTGGLFGGSAVNFVGLLIGAASQFGVVLALTQALSKRDAGLFLIGFAVFRLAVGFFGLGLNVTATRYVAILRSRAGDAAVRTSRTLLGISVLSGVVGAVLLAATSDLFGRAFNSDEIPAILVVMGMGIPLSTFTLTAAGAVRGDRRNTAASFLDPVADSGFRFLGLCGGLWWAGTALGAAVGFTVGGAIAAFAAVMLTQTEWRGSGWCNREEIRDVMWFTGYQWGTVFTGAAFRWADAVLLGLWRSPAEVAVYSTATRAIWLGVVFVLPIGLAFQPIIAQLAEVGDLVRLRTLYRSAARLATSIGCPPLILTGVCAAPLLVAIYGENYRSGALALTFFAAGQAVNTAAGPAATVITMVGRADLTLRFNVVALVTDIALNMALIPLFGMSGAGAAWCVSLILLCGLRFQQCHREIGIQIFDPWLLRAVVSVGLGACASVAVIHALAGEDAVLIVVAGYLSGCLTVAVSMWSLGLRPADIYRPRPSGALSDVRG